MNYTTEQIEFVKMLGYGATFTRIQRYLSNPNNPLINEESKKQIVELILQMNGVLSSSQLPDLRAYLSTLLYKLDKLIDEVMLPKVDHVVTPMDETIASTLPMVRIDKSLNNENCFFTITYPNCSNVIVSHSNNYDDAMHDVRKLYWALGKYLKLNP